MSAKGETQSVVAVQVFKITKSFVNIVQCNILGVLYMTSTKQSSQPDTRTYIIIKKLANSTEVSSHAYTTIFANLSNLNAIILEGVRGHKTDWHGY